MVMVDWQEINQSSQRNRDEGIKKLGQLDRLGDGCGQREMWISQCSGRFLTECSNKGNKGRILEPAVCQKRAWNPDNQNFLPSSDVNTNQTRAFWTATNAQSTGGGQGFTRCGCNKACQTNACKCNKSKIVCNSRCHGRSSNPKCLNHD